MGGADPDSFAALFEESLKGEEVKEGDIVRGTVITVAKDYAVIDIGYKSEGLDLRSSEFRRPGWESLGAPPEIRSTFWWKPRRRTNRS